jgi:plastocyanin
MRPNPSLLLLAALLAACSAPPGGSPAAETAASLPVTGEPAATQPGAATQPAAATQPPATEPPTPAPVAAGIAQGIVRFVDDTGHNDRVIATLTNLPRPEAATEYELWLTGGPAPLSAGRFAPDEAGVATVDYRAPEASNLVGTYNGALVTIEPLPDPDPAASADVLLRGELTGGALTHVRHVLVSFPATPNARGFGIGMRELAEQALRFAGLQSEAVAAGDLADVRAHAERIVNLIEGAQGPDYGDLDGDGQVADGGDGFGLLQGGQLAGYLLAAEDHARLAAESPEASEFMRQRAAEMKVTVANARERFAQLRDAELHILEAETADEAQPLVAAALALADRALVGVDANADERIDPIAGEGGALTAYIRGQLLATISVSPDGTLPPPLATAGPPVGAGVVVHMENFVFVEPVITIAPGTTVTWINDDSRNVPHTVTSKGSALFDSGEMPSGAQFEFTFQQPGTFPYVCTIHGDFMSGTVIVGGGAEPTP